MIHHTPSIDQITPTTPPDAVAAALARPAVERSSESNWWRWPNVVEGFRRRVSDALQSIPEFPPPREPRGIVIVGGGKYLPSAYVTVRVLRHVGCQLPIEMWHFGDELDRPVCQQLKRYGVRFVNADDVARTHPFRFLHGHWWRGWQLKAFALLHTRFRELLLLDADCYPVRDPEYLFQWPEYCRRGVVLWPDLPRSPTIVTDEACALFEIDWPSGRLTESGQMLVDRQASWRQLVLAGIYNQCADITYHYVWGDKDTFPAAWQRIGKPYGRMWPECSTQADCLLQHDFLGRVIFQHRVSDKFTIDAPTFNSSAQPHRENRYHGALAHESFCFHALNELKELRRPWPRRSSGDALSVPTAASAPKDRHAPGSILEMYPRVPVPLLLQETWQRRFRDLFLDSGELKADPFATTPLTQRGHAHCVSVSLFRQHVDNRLAHELPVDLGRWQRKYWSGLMRIVRELEAFADWKLRVYVEHDLGDLAHAALGRHPRIELYRMAINSIGGTPGMLWRFLALGDQSLETVLVTDIDEPLLAKQPLLESFHHSPASLGRLGSFTSPNNYLIAPRESSAKNYPTIIASHVLSRPNRFSFNLAATLRGFMAHRKWHAATKRHWAYAADEARGPYNEPVNAHLHGWGSHWYMYCFDERFLKHVLYYHFADRGELYTWAPGIEPKAMSPEAQCDFRYTATRNNPTRFSTAESQGARRRAATKRATDLAGRFR